MGGTVKAAEADGSGGVSSTRRKGDGLGRRRGRDTGASSALS